MKMKSFIGGSTLLSLPTYIAADVLQRNPTLRTLLLLPIWFVAGWAAMIFFIKHMSGRSYKASLAPASIIFAFSFGMTYFMGSFFWFAFFKRLAIGIQCEAYVGISFKLLELLGWALFVLIGPIIFSIVVQTVIARLFFPGLSASRLFGWITLANLTFFVLWVLIVSIYFFIVGLPVDPLTCFIFV